MRQKIFKLKGIPCDKERNGFVCPTPELIIDWSHYFDDYEDFLACKDAYFDVTVRVHIKEIVE